MNIETGVGQPHSVIGGLQRMRYNDRIRRGLEPWSSTIDEELSYIVSDFRAAGFNDNVIRQVLRQQYRMLDKLGVPYSGAVGL